MQTIRLWFKKEGLAKYISHLDLVRCMARALKRSGLPVWYTQGFNPHIYLTFALPLSLGQESECEIMQFRLVEELPLNEVKDRLNAALPAGLQVLAAALPQQDLQAIAAADYRVSLEGTPGLAERFLAFARQPQIKTLKRSKKGPKEVDIRPLVLACDGEEGEGGRVLLSLRLAAGGQQNLNPALLIDAYCAQSGESVKTASIRRTALYDGAGAPFC